MSYKTVLCKFYARGTCLRGAACTFAHGSGELRGRNSSADGGGAAGAERLEVSYDCPILGQTITVLFDSGTVIDADEFWLAFVAPFYSTLPTTSNAFMEYRSRFCNPTRQTTYRNRPFKSDEQEKFTLYLQQQYTELKSADNPWVSRTNLSLEDVKKLSKNRAQQTAQVQCFR